MFHVSEKELFSHGWCSTHMRSGHCVFLSRHCSNCVNCISVSASLPVRLGDIHTACERPSFISFHRTRKTLRFPGKVPGQLSKTRNTAEIVFRVRNKSSFCVDKLNVFTTAWCYKPTKVGIAPDALFQSLQCFIFSNNPCLFFSQPLWCYVRVWTVLSVSRSFTNRPALCSFIVIFSHTHTPLFSAHSLTGIKRPTGGWKMWVKTDLPFIWKLFLLTSAIIELHNKHSLRMEGVDFIAS